MTQAAHPNPAQLPTLTEVIELTPPTPVGDRGMTSAPRYEAPAPGSVAGTPIVTGGLSASQARSTWTPMTTVVLPTLLDVAMPPLPAPVPIVRLSTLEPSMVAPVALEPPSANLPVLDAVVPELALTASPVFTSAAIAAPISAPISAPIAAPIAEPLPAIATLPSPMPVQPDISEAQLAQRVLSVVQKQIDGMIEFRLKEAMAPILARHSEALVRDLRDELSRTMADVVARAVTQEMAKLRQR